MGDTNSGRCPLCGGPVNVNGQTLVRVGPPVSTRHLPMSPAPAPENDPESAMTPHERFARAIERRDTLIRDRRIAGSAGRRSTDRTKLAEVCFCNEGWICEQHPDQGWPHDDCAGPGMRCSRCNTDDPPRMPQGWQSKVK